MDRMAGGMGFMDLDQELSRADVESVSSDNTVASGTNGNVQVVVRVRPPSSRERDQGYIKCVGVDTAAHSVTLNFRPQPRTFTFDYVADEVVGQEDIFSAVGKPITDACLQGYHCCLIAYGQTGAGKTFTMEGPDSESSSGGSPGFLAKANLKRHEKRGLIPRILDYIFQKMAAEKTQIYNEQVSDLLDPGSYNLTIHEDAKAGMYVEGLQEVVVSTAEATYGVFRRGSENRHVGMTAMNLESSRSHSVFTVVVESQRRNDGGVMNRRTSRFYLVDLAGSERQKHSESAGIRLKEAGSINKSLSALGNVIKALVDISEGKIRHVPYRDSKLTFLLKDALGGNSKCTLIANVSPAEKNIDETLSTLKFAQRAKLIHNTAIVNEDMFGNPAVMGEEIRRLRLEIAALRANVGSGPGGDQSLMSGHEIQSESARTSRLEHIISQSVKRSLEAERKTEMEMHVLVLKLQATQAMCERLEKTLQSQKMIIRLRENTIKRLEIGRPSMQPDEIVHDLREEIEQLRKQIEHHPDVVRFKMELDLCRGQLDEYEEERKDEELLSQIAQLENLNQTLKIEFQEMVEEKTKIFKELEEAKSSRDVGINQLTTFEEQFVMLREAIEKYRIEAGEAVHKQEKAEEKLQECTKEQDEVWRRCNLAEAQATEYAQELTALRSQAEKMKVAFNEQTKLQEDIFLELQKATDELEISKRELASLQSKLEEAIATREQMGTKLILAEDERIQTSRSLEEMITTCEQLALSMKQKDASHVDLLSRLEQADLSAKSLDEKVAALSLCKAEAEESRDAALSHKDRLLKVLSELTIDKESALNEERTLSSEKIERLQTEMVDEIGQISSVLQCKLSQIEDMENRANQHSSAILQEENLRKVAEAEANELRHQLELMIAEISTQKLDISDMSLRLESSSVQLSSLLEEKATLEFKVIESEKTSSSLNAAKTDREEAEKMLSETNTMLMEAKVSLEALTVENETLKSVMQEAERKLLEVSLNFETKKEEYDALVVENQTLKADLERKTVEFEALTRQKSTLDACLSEELLRTAAAEKHIKELMETIDSLQADVAVMESLKSDILEKTKEVSILEQHAVEQINKIIITEKALQNAQEDFKQVSTTKMSLEDEKLLLSEKMADLEVASTAMQGIIQRLEEEKISFQTMVNDLQEETQNVKNVEAALKASLQANEEAMRMNASALEDVKSELGLKALELQRLETQVADQLVQIEALNKVNYTLEKDYNGLVTTVKSLEDEKEGLSKNIADLEVALKAMEQSIESLELEKAALQSNLGVQFEHSEKNIISQHPTEEVKDVDISNHVIHGETQVCMDFGTNHVDLLVPKKGELAEVETNHKYSDEKEEDSRNQEQVRKIQETDARLVAALADVTDHKSHVGGCMTKLDLALKPQGQAEEQSLVSLSRAKDLEVQVALLTNDCSKLREALCLANHRTSTLESELGFCRGQEVEYEKELESSLKLLEGVTMALGEKKSEGFGFPQMSELISERDLLSRELEEVKGAKSIMEAGSLKLQREVDEIAGKLAQAEDKLAEEQGMVSQLEGTRLELETQVELHVAEICSLCDKLETVEELLQSAKELGLEKQFEVLEADKCRLAEEMQVLGNTFEDNMSSLHRENAQLSNQIQILTQKLLASEEDVAVLKTHNLELSWTVDSHKSRILDLDTLLKNRASDHEVEMLALAAQVGERESQLGELSGQFSKHSTDLQELRDEIQYNLEEVDYEFQKHVIDTEARMVDLENLKKLVQSDTLQLTARMSAENSKFSVMLGTLEAQIVDHRRNVTAWVVNLNSLKSELLRVKKEKTEIIEGFELRVKQLEMEVLEEQKMGREYKQEVVQLRGRLVEQAKRMNPFSWNNSISNSAKPDARSLQGGAQSSTRVDIVAKDEFIPKFAAQQKKRIAMSSKERPGGKSKTSYANQNSLSSLRALTESLPSGQGNMLQTSRSQSRLPNASSGVPAVQVVERPKKSSSTTRTPAKNRQPLRSLSSNTTSEINRPSPVVLKSRYNLRRREKVEDSIGPPEPPCSRKRRRLS